METLTGAVGPRMPGFDEGEEDAERACSVLKLIFNSEKFYFPYNQGVMTSPMPFGTTVVALEQEKEGYQCLFAMRTEGPRATPAA